MHLQKDYFLVLLHTVHPSEASLKSVAMYIRLFEDDFSSIVDGISHVFNNSGIHHKLTLLYLINEVWQGDRNEGNNTLRASLIEFVRRNFHKVKKEAQHIPSIARRVQELKAVWTSRNILNLDEKYSPEEISQQIYDKFNDKKGLVSYLEAVLSYYKPKGST